MRRVRIPKGYQIQALSRVLDGFAIDLICSTEGWQITIDTKYFTARKGMKHAVKTAEREIERRVEEARERARQLDFFEPSP